MKKLVRIGRSWCPWVVLAHAVWAACSSASADVLTYNVADDAYVDSASSKQSNNYGAATSLKVLASYDGSLCHGLIQLPAEMASIAAGDVSDVKLYVRINQNRLNDQGAAKTVRLLPLTASFLEGAGNGTATGDGATWLTSNGTVSWGTAGGDYDSLHFADAADSTVASGGWFSWDITSLWSNSTVRSNLLNYGAILTLNDESNPGASNMPRAVFYTSDSGAGYSPYFEVTTAPEPASLLLLVTGLPVVWWLRKR